jgi:O-antigen/teichoic acid export membrane protein
MLPKAGRRRNRQEVRHYTKRTLLISLLMALFLGGVVLIAQPVITFLYGERYVASAGLFMALTAVVLFDLVTSSLFLLALPLNKPRVLAVGDWLRVGIMGTSAWLLIPSYGGYGAVAARLLARVLGSVYTLLALRGSAKDEALRTEDEGLSQPLHLQ